MPVSRVVADSMETAKYVEKLRTLPEPISKSEKQQLIVAQTRLEKTRQGQEVQLLCLPV